MFKLETASYPAAYSLYRTLDAFFPLIGAVLLNEQDGVVYADDRVAPTQFYVEHAFGFAQIFGLPVPSFEKQLRDYLLVQRSFSVAKVRLYTPHLPDFLRSSEGDSSRSQRQRFILDSDSDIAPESCFRQSKLENARFSDVDRSNVAKIENQFGVVGRFWRTPEEFILKAHAVVVFVNEDPAAICYAAAVADSRAEIDVLTLPEYRHLGLGKLVVIRFNQQSRAQGLAPVWDCFTNNTGSMTLCQTTGFFPGGQPYPFFTINK